MKLSYHPLGRSYYYEKDLDGTWVLKPYEEKDEAEEEAA